MHKLPINLSHRHPRHGLEQKIKDLEERLDTFIKRYEQNLDDAALVQKYKRLASRL